MFKTLKLPKEFYESIGFTVFHGDISQKWIIMKNDTATIGLFQGMFERNIPLTLDGMPRQKHVPPLPMLDRYKKLLKIKVFH